MLSCWATVQFRTLHIHWRTGKLAGLEVIKRSSFIEHGESSCGNSEECETNDSYTASDNKTSDINCDNENIDTDFVEETLSNSDNLEAESGVESATGDVTEAELLDLNSYFALADGNIYLGDLDLTTEQAQETLKYFSEYNFLIFLKG